MPATTSTKLVSEFLGTYLLVFTVGCNVLKGNPTWGVVSIASVLMVLIYSLNDASGANFNPAVTLALAMSKAKEWGEAWSYMATQFAAGICASLTYSGLYQKAFALGPTGAYTWKEAGICELLYTAMLCFVVLNVAATSKKVPNQYFGLAIGFVIIAGGYGAGAVSGGAFNPALAVGIELAAKMQGFVGPIWSPVYIVFQFAGAGLAAMLFRLVRPEEFGEEAKPLISCLTSEFIGTFFLVLTVGLNVLSSSKAAVFSIAASLTSMVYALSDVSGANFNPAVTVAISMRGKLAASDAVMYIAAQLAAGVVASLFYVTITSKGFPLGPGDGFGYVHVAVAEIIFTFVLCYVVLAVATTRKGLPDLYGLAIGMSLLAGGYAIGGVSGGSLNPAVSLGIVSGSMFWNHGSLVALPYYVAFELLGGALASAVFSITHAKECEDAWMSKTTDSNYGSA